MLTTALFVLLPLIALQLSPTVFAGMFDVTPRQMVFVAAIAGMLAYTITTTATLVLAYGDQRFDVPHTRVPCPDSSGTLQRPFAAAHGACSSRPDARRARKSRRRHAVAAMAVAGGRGGGTVLISYVPFRLVPALVTLLPLSSSSGPLVWVLRSIPMLRPGFIRRDPETGADTILPGHRFAFGLSLMSAALYWGLGLLRGGVRGHQVPALGYLLLLFMIVCWSLSFVAFVFDRYRIPIVLILGVWVAVTGFRNASDHYYQLVAALPPDAPSPGAVLDVGNQDDDGIILVAANGGGIQAAAWTARVLAGIEERCRAELGLRCHFNRSIRLISSVSGGSVGAMYFTSQYSTFGLPEDAVLEDVVSWTMSSSLDYVGWGLLYRDVLRPFVSPNDVEKYEDRGWALEQAWGRFGDYQSPLSLWRDGVAAGWRPATIFNATVADSGERLMIGTSELSIHHAGRKNFSELYPGQDVAISTATRLSATFPYVAPSSRSDKLSASFHAVDGGYTDNYGMSSLIDWLDEALKSGTRVKRVLVLQLRGAPPDLSPRDHNRGWFFQAYAPLDALLSVRTSGQLAHNDQEFDLLRRSYANGENKVAIGTAVVQFCGPAPPLSWHLTAPQQEMIKDEWNKEVGHVWPSVKAFLSENAPPPSSLDSRCPAR